MAPDGVYSRRWTSSVADFITARGWFSQLFSNSSGCLYPYHDHGAMGTMGTMGTWLDGGSIFMPESMERQPTIQIQ
jgi:hypothetical protein